MLKRSRTARSDNRNGDIFGDDSCQFQIVAILGSVAVHGSQKYLPGTEFIGFYRPFDGIDAHVDTSAVFINIPARSVLSSFCINRHNHALGTEFVGCFRN